MSQEEASTHPKESSFLFERHVIWVLLAFLLLAIWYRFIPLLVVSLFLIILSLIITVWKNKSLQKINLEMQLSRSRVFVDDQFIISASIINQKWLPLVWLEWEFPAIDAIKYGEDREEKPLIRFLWILWFQKVNWELRGQAMQRGVYHIGRVTLRSGDGFRFSEREQTYSLKSMLYVYPRLIPIHLPDYWPAISWGTAGNKGGFLEDPLLIRGIREYQDGDEERRINWLASARTGRLQTNVYQPVVVPQLHLYIDVDGFDQETDYGIEQTPESVAKRKETFEWFLSVIASVVVKYGEQGVALSLTSNALNQSGQPIQPTRPQKDLIPLLDQLAHMTSAIAHRSSTQLDKLLAGRKKRTGPLFIFCHSLSKQYETWYQQHKHHLGDVRFFYVQESEYAVRLAAKAHRMDTLVLDSAVLQET